MLNITRPKLALAAAAVLAGIAVAPLALAQTTPQQGSQVLSLGEIESRLTAQGFRVIEIERDDRKFEVKALNAQGQCVELNVDLFSGDVRRTRFDDDCNASGRHRGRSH